MNCFIPETVNTGEYSLRIVTRVEDGEWKIVALSNREAGIPNAIPITVTEGETNGGGYGRVLTRFEPSITSVSHNEQFSVSVGIRVVDPFDTFSGGQLSAALVNDDNEIVGVVNRLINISPAGGSPNINNCSFPDAVPSGSYKLRIVIRPAIGGGEYDAWRIVTMSIGDIPTSYDFMVE